MTIKVLYRKLELVFNSIQDVDMFADELEQKTASKDTPDTAKRDESNQRNGTGDSGETGDKVGTNHQPDKAPVATGTMSDFIKGLNKQTMTLISALANAPNGLSDAELREKIGIESKLVFAGIMSAVAKSAIRLGIGFENVVIKTVLDNRSGKKKYHYSLTDDVRKELMANPPPKLF